MNAQLDDKALEDALEESLAEISSQTAQITHEDFLKAATQVLEATGGHLLFSMDAVSNETNGGDAGEHIAAGCIGHNDERQVLLLSQAVSGGPLKVEHAAKSSKPLAKIADSYAALMNALNSAA